jgi:urate oxidase
MEQQVINLYNVSIYSISNTHLLYVQYITDISWQSETHTFVVGLRLNKNENLDNIYQCLPMRWWLVVYGEGNRNTDETTDLQ